MKVIVPNRPEYRLPDSITAAEVKELLVSQGEITDAFTYTVEDDGELTVSFVAPRGGEKGEK